MKDGFRQSMAWLHTWVGLIPGWLLFVVFVSGTAAYFNEEITLWMSPEFTEAASYAEAADQAAAYLGETAPGVERWYIGLPTERAPSIYLFWQPGAGQRGQSAYLDGTGAPVSSRDTSGGNFLYRFHFDLHYMPVIWARWIVGVAAMGMLIAILSGVVTHKKIYKDFFMLRFGKGQRSWLDVHNVSAVLALPFHLMITYTGLVTLMFLYMPWGIAANYDSQDAFYSEVFPGASEVAASGTAAPLAPLGPMVAQATRLWEGVRPSAMNVYHPGDANARVEMFASDPGLVSGEGTLIFDGVTGAALQELPADGPANQTREAMINLHAGRYAAPALRWLYFISGLFGSAMVGSGLVLWTQKRRAREDARRGRPGFGFQLASWLNIGTIVGFPTAIAGYFWANRLLPLSLAGRAEWEVHCLFIAWAVMMLYPAFRPPARAWMESLFIAAGAYGLLPVVNALTTGRNLVVSLARGDWVMAGFDLTMLGVSALFLVAAFKVRARVRDRRRSVPLYRGTAKAVSD
jgi:uncharacterized iron-regulated membrane protein